MAGNAVPAETMILEEIVIEFAGRAVGGRAAGDVPRALGHFVVCVHVRVRIRWPDRVAYGLIQVCLKGTARSPDPPFRFRGMKPELDGKAGPHGEPSQS